jgi:hypothetical protein
MIDDILHGKMLEIGRDIQFSVWVGAFGGICTSDPGPFVTRMLPSLGARGLVKVVIPGLGWAEGERFIW